MAQNQARANSPNASAPTCDRASRGVKCALWGSMTRGAPSSLARRAARRGAAMMSCSPWMTLMGKGAGGQGGKGRNVRIRSQSSGLATTRHTMSFRLPNTAA